MIDTSFAQAASAYGKAMSNPASLGQESGSVPVHSAFGQMVSDSLQQAADTAYKGEGIATQSVGNKAELTDLVTAMSETELTVKTVVAVRDRVISAYQDILRMPI